MEGEFTKQEREITAQEVYDAIDTISQSSWGGANYPVVSYASKDVYNSYNRNPFDGDLFWKEVLNTKHFLNSKENRSFNPEYHILFVLHSFRSEGQDNMFKAITTLPKSFLQDPENLINYRIHGLPCENRSRGSYPTLRDFWNDFYDRLPENDKDLYPIPDTNYRRNLIEKSI